MSEPLLDEPLLLWTLRDGGIRLHTPDGRVYEYHPTPPKAPGKGKAADLGPLSPDTMTLGG